MPKFSIYPLRFNNVLDLHKQREVIDTDPPYQRLSIWNREQQQRFIDSVINGMDTPKLYFHEILGETGSNYRYRYSVIDGKQRILALWAFIDDVLPLPSDFIYFDNESYWAGGLTYNELPNKYPILRSRFDDFELPVMLVHADSEEFIEQLFWRLNVQEPLTAPEKRNVLGGPLPLVIRRIGLTPFFSEAVGIRNNRMQHFDLAAKLLYISYSNDFVATKKTPLDNFVLMMKRARENGDQVASDASLEEIESKTKCELMRMREFFGPDSPLLRSTGRITLYFHLFRLCTSQITSVPICLFMLERFNADVTTARRKSQRMSRGSGESLDSLEDVLVRFDQEKQSLNDGTALVRQYNYMKRFMAHVFNCELPDPQ